MGTRLITEADHTGSGTVRVAQSITTALRCLLLCGGGRKEKIMNIEINGVTLQGDFMDAGFMEVLEPALLEVQEDMQGIRTQPRGLVAAGYDALNKALDRFFNKVFGPDTSEQLFGGSRNVMIRMEALAKVDQLAKESRKQFNDFSNRYSQRQQQNGFNSMRGHKKPKQNRT